MNLIWHIIKKDLRRVGWVLVVWALTGAYLIAYKRLDAAQFSIWDNLGIVSLITHAALVFALIAAIVQEDGLNGVNEFWRTRPIAAGRMLTAKLILVLTCFVVVPMLVAAAVHLWLLGPVHGFVMRELLMPLVIGAGVVLASAAVAACTKDLVQYFLGGMACQFLVFSLGFWFASLAPAEPLRGLQAMQVTNTKVLINITLTGFVSVGVLLNQYYTRRALLSISVIAGTVVILAFVGAFWRWPILC